MQDSSCCHPERKKLRPLWLNPNFLTLGVFSVLFLLAFKVPRFAVFSHHVFYYFGKIWWAVILGFLLGGLLDRYVPREYVSHLLAKPKKRSILYATMLGFLMSACSHGILAIAVELHRKGASTPVVVSFLLASPWANLPITFMMIGFFGWKAWFIIFGALLIAIVTGLVFQFLESKGMIEANKHTLSTEPDYSVMGDIKRRWIGHLFSFKNFFQDAQAVLKAALSLANMTLWWILIGVGLSGIAATFIPSHWFHRFMGPTFTGLLVTLGLATVMEVCSEGTAPLAFEIYKQTGAFGNAFVFLMAGIVTDLTEIGVVASNVGKKTAFFIPLITVPQVILLGILANLIF